MLCKCPGLRAREHEEPATRPPPHPVSPARGSGLTHLQRDHLHKDGEVGEVRAAAGRVGQVPVPECTALAGPHAFPRAEDTAEAVSGTAQPEAQGTAESLRRGPWTRGTHVAPSLGHEWHQTHTMLTHRSTPWETGMRCPKMLLVGWGPCSGCSRTRHCPAETQGHELKQHHMSATGTNTTDI